MSEVRQRWRVEFRRDEEARYLAHLDAVKLWERAFRRGRIPIALSEGHTPKSRLVFAASLPLGMLGEREIVDLYLAERLTIADLRARLERELPSGYELAGLHDVWVGEPAVAARLVAADYRVTVAGPAERTAVDLAVAGLWAADRVIRVKRRETKAVEYDLRPLLLGLRVQSWAADVSSGRGLGALWMRLRHSQEEGSGRPDEVIAELTERLTAAAGEPLIAECLVRERLWLADETPSSGA